MFVSIADLRTSGASRANEMPGLIFFLIVAAVLLAVVAGNRWNKTTTESWAAASRNLGLAFSPGGLLRSRKIEGRVEGFYVKVDTYTRRSGTSSRHLRASTRSRTCTRFTVFFPRSLGLGLRLTKEGFLTGLTKLFGVQDVQVGDGSFDSEVLVKASNPARVREFLTPARRMRVRRFFSSHPTATIDDAGVRATFPGLVRSSQSLESIVRSLVRLAWHLTGEREEDRSMETVLRARDEGRPDEAMRILETRRRRARPPPPRKPPPLPERQPALESAAEVLEDAILADSVDERVLEGELLMLADRKEEARVVFEEALEASPQDPEIREWVTETSAAPSPEPSPLRIEVTDESAADLPGAPGAEPEMASSVEEVCADLFGTSRTSIDASRIFEKEYLGKRVEWRGKLKSAGGYPFDFVFGSEAGGKAIVEIHDAGESVYGGSKVFAVVKIPVEGVDALEDAAGKDVEIRGELLKVDGFMRNLYVTAGSVEVAD